MRLTFLLLCFAAAFQAGDSWPVSGVVLDPSGASVGGARIALTCGQQPPRRARSGPDGSFRFTTSGRDCAIEVRQKGFESVVLPAPAGGEALVVRLALSEVHQRISVDAREETLALAADANRDAVELDREMLDSLPVMDQDILGAVAGFLSEGALGAGGYSLVVDGMETDDIGVSPSAIESVRINQNPYSAEFHSPGRGRVEVITRQGQTAFHGGVNFLYRDYRLNARNAFASARPPERRNIVEGYLTGPLTRDGRTSFLLSAEYERDDEWDSVYALTPAGLVSLQHSQPDRDREISVRVRRLLGDAQSLSIRYEWEKGTGLGLGAGGFRLPETAYDEHDAEHDVTVQHQTVVAGRFLNQFSMRFESDRERVASQTEGRPRYVVHDAFTAGGAQRRRRESETGVELHNAVSLSRGDHSVRFGVSVSDLSRRGYADESGREGTFYFTSLDEYAANRPYLHEYQAGDGRVAFWTADAGAFFQDDWRIRDGLTMGMGVRYEYRNWPAGRGNVAPRWSLAWSPGRERRTVIRAGAGLFHDRLGSSSPRDSLLLDGRHLLRFEHTDPWAETAPDRPPLSIVALAPNLRSPILSHYSVGVERELWTKTTIALNYHGVHGWRLYRSSDLNAPAGPAGERPNPAFSTVRQVESDARMTSHGLDVSFRGRLGRFVEGGVQYGYGHAWNDTGGESWIPPENLHPSREWARADYDRRHRLRSYGSIEAGSWFDIGFLLAAHTGQPYSVTTGSDDNGDSRLTDRPPGEPRNGRRGPGAVTLDLRWSKEFSLTPRNGGEDHPEVRLAVDAFNVLNRVNYSSPVGNLNSPFFGQPVAARSARRVQLSLRFRF